MKRATIVIAGWFGSKITSQEALWFEGKVWEVLNYDQSDFDYTLEEAKEELVKAQEFLNKNECVMCEAYVRENFPIEDEENAA